MAKTVGYMVTWTTYGTWLQGDRRGYVRDGQVLGEDKALHDANRGRLAQRPVRLGKENKAVVERTILGKAQRIEQSILAIAVCSNHVHIVVGYDGRPIEETVRRYKNASTVALREKGLEGRVWTRGYDKRFCFDEASLEERIRYVQGHDS